MVHGLVTQDSLAPSDQRRELTGQASNKNLAFSWIVWLPATFRCLTSHEVVWGSFPVRANFNEPS